MFGSSDGVQAHQAINGVGGGMLAGVVMADLKLAQQSDGQQLNAGDNQHRAHHKQGPVMVHHARWRIADLHAQQKHGHAAAAQDAQHAQPAEEMQRPAM